MTAEIAQLGERQTEDLKVPGSNTENSLRHEFWIIPGLGNFFPQFYSYKTSCLFSQFYSFLAAVETRFASVSKKFPLIVCIHYFFYESLQFIWRYF